MDIILKRRLKTGLEFKLHTIPQSSTVATILQGLPPSLSRSIPLSITQDLIHVKARIRLRNRNQHYIQAPTGRSRNEDMVLCEGNRYYTLNLAEVADEWAKKQSKCYAHTHTHTRARARAYIYIYIYVCVCVCVCVCACECTYVCLDKQEK